MLPRTASANVVSSRQQIRRARSTPTVQCRRRTSASSITVVDDVAFKQHAVLAATIAYERGCERNGRATGLARRGTVHGTGLTPHFENEFAGRATQEHARGANSRSHRIGRSPSKKSQKSRVGRSEGQGSHFEAASHSATTTHQRRQSSQSKRLPFSTNDLTDSNTRSRRATVSTFLYSNHLRPVDVVDNSTSRVDNQSPFAIRHIRKTRSMYTGTTDQPAPTSIDAISFSASKSRSPLQLKTNFQSSHDDTVNSQSTLIDPTVTDTSIAGAVTQKLQPPPPPLTHQNIYRVDQRVAKARDAALQQFHVQKLRSRASAMFKRISSAESASADLRSNKTEHVAHGSGRPIIPPPVETIKILQNSKSFGDKMKSMKNVFRRPSSLQIGLPVQQVEATRAYFGNKLTENSPKSSPSTSIKMSQIPEAIPYAPPTAKQLRWPEKEGKGRAVSPTTSEGDATVITAKSRVTSWADSTLGGISERGESKMSNRLMVIHEDQNQQIRPLGGTHNAQSSTWSSSKHSAFGSFFRRGRKTSNAGEVYAKPEEHNQHDARLSRTSMRKTSADIETLPSQRRRLSLLVPTIARATVRVVSSSPDIPSVVAMGSGKDSITSGRKISACSTIKSPTPVPEQMVSPLGIPNPSSTGPSSGSWLSKRRANRVQKTPKISAPVIVAPSITTPTSEQIAARIEKSNDRWKQSLDENRSLFYPYSPLHSSPGTVGHIDSHDGAVESQDLITSAAVPSVEDDFTTVREPPAYRSIDVISPSIYSRATDSSPTKFPHQHDSVLSVGSNGNEATGTAVIITSYQPTVKYPLPSSPNKGNMIVPQLAKTSRDWRVWLSAEISDLAKQPPAEDLTLRNEFLVHDVEAVPKRAHSKHRREYAQICDGEDFIIGSVSDNATESLENVPEQSHSAPQRPQPKRIASEALSIRDRYSPEDRPSSRLHMALKTRSTSCMNERFPLINTGRPPRRPSSRKRPPAETPSARGENAARPSQSSTSSTLTVPILKAGGTVRPPYLRTAKSTNSFQRSKSSLARYTVNATPISNVLAHGNTNCDEIPSSEQNSSAALLNTLDAHGQSLSATETTFQLRAVNTRTTAVETGSSTSTRTLPALGRPRSAVDVRNNSIRSASRRERVFRTTTPAPVNIAEPDNTLVDILRGPYHDEVDTAFGAASTPAFRIERPFNNMETKPIDFGLTLAADPKVMRKPASFYKENSPFPSSPSRAEEYDGSPVRNMDALCIPSTPPRASPSQFSFDISHSARDSPVRRRTSEMAIRNLYRSSDDFARILHAPNSSRTSEHFARKLREMNSEQSSPVTPEGEVPFLPSGASALAQYLTETPTSTSRVGRGLENQTPTSAGQLLAERFLSERRRLRFGRSSLEVGTGDSPSAMSAASTPLGSPVFL